MPAVRPLHAPPSTDVGAIPPLVASLRRTFDTGATRPLAWRMAELRRLRAMLGVEESALLGALRADLGKCAFEAYASELAQVLAEIDLALNQLPSWMQPERVRTPVVHQPGKSVVVREPLGIVLIIAPWNYPLQLSLNPLVGAIAAGNCAVLKPSEVAPATSAVLAELLPRYLDRSAFAVVEGGAHETTALLAQPWDHIFYTGNGTVGRIVAHAAADHLTPITLELGGKSPTIVDTDVDLDLAARRIAWGKYFNAGQTCTAPDYALVLGGREQAFVQAVRRTIHAFYGADPKVSPDYGRIVNERHTQRLASLLGDGTIEVGGEVDTAERYVSPTVMTRVSLHGALMTDEIFGPILPVLPVDTLDDAIAFVNARSKPLALYVFSENRQHQRRILDRTSSGGACVNDTLSHVAIPTLPFGGVGPSGMGAYHGRASFETFSHRRAIFDRATWLDIKLRYAPYLNHLPLLRRLL